MTETGRLFDPDPPATRTPAPEGMVAVRVLPDISGLDKEFDYLLSAEQAGAVAIGDQVKVVLKGRTVSGWITGIGLDRPLGLELRPVTKVWSAGPSADVVELARWTAWRWSGRLASVLKSASPPRITAPVGPKATVDASHPGSSSSIDVIRHSPTADVLGLLMEAAKLGDALVVTPRVDLARTLAGRLRQRGVTVRVHPRDWAAAANRGGLVIGARSAVWARLPDLAVVVVIDEHDEALQEERNPTWHGRDVAVERARRAGVPCWLVSPSPSLTALTMADNLRAPSRSEERSGWPIVEVVDRRNDEPGRGGLFSSRVVTVVRQPGSVLCVLNRKGRAVMLACASCGELVLTEDGQRLMVGGDGHLVCPSTGETRPLVCATCGATGLKRLRLGVVRAAEELAALVGEPVDELSGGAGSRDRRPTRVVVGTEAALHQTMAVDRVVFLDFDQELLAPRYRAGEQAMALLLLAARLVGGRGGADGGGRIIIQTRTPQHRLLGAAVRSDPAGFAAQELDVRRSLAFPPFGALAELSGSGAAEFSAAVGQSPEATVYGPRHDGRYLIRTSVSDALATVLDATPRPAARIRVAVDPPRA